MPELRLQVLYVDDEQAVRQADGDDLKRTTRVIVTEEHQPVVDSGSGAGRVRVTSGLSMT